MNDRMTELYAEACLYSRQYTKAGDVPEFIKRMAEKFAELVVNECALVGRAHILERHGMNLDYDGQVLVEEAIRNYFKEQQ